MAASSVLIAALSHVAGGGANPGGLGVVLGLVFAFLASTALAGRRLSGPRLSIAVACSQFVFHVLFSLGAALPGQVVSAAAAGSGEAGSMLGMVMSGGHRATLPTFGGASPAAMGVLDASSMWAGHAVAAALTIALLLHGDRAFRTLVRLARERLIPLVTASREVVDTAGRMRGAAARVVADRSGVPPLEALLVARPHRGPPVAARPPAS